MRKHLVILALIGLVVAACGGDDNGSADTTTTSAAAATTTTAAEAMTGIHITDTDLGGILVDPDGFTLYVFTNDASDESTCYDSCAELWPPVPGDTEIGEGLDTGMFGTTTRDDGSEQLTVNGQPLYTYTPDENPGDTNGQGFNDVWFVVDADGSMVGNPEASNASTVTTSDYGLDY